ncbi:MAG: cell division ATP-binding protein FtsE [Lachnospiraceae bacterium]|jgi:cell division transport system ATP-binding protein|nr:cell division ATP-binding protein FtsE [Lachnospiraceae bacterium]
MIEFRRVSKTYNGAVKADALNDVSLSIGEGEFVFIIGDSGAGKSTMIKLLMGEEKASSGSVLVDGINVGKLKNWQLPRYRRHFGVIFQDFRLLQNYTVYDNVAFAQRVVGASRKRIQKRVPKILADVGLETKQKSFPAQLSGGEQQRVALARAVVNGPQYLLADEPTGNLDPANSEEVMRLLESFNRSGTTVIVVTHDVAMVDQFRKRVVTMKEGQIVSDIREGGYDNA